MEVLRYDRRVTRSRDILEDTSQKDSSIFWPWSKQSVTPEIRDVASRWNAAALLFFLFPPKTLFLGPHIALKKVRSHHPLSLLPNVIMSLFMDYSTMDHDDGATLTSSNRSLQRRKARPVAALRLSGCSVLRDRHAIRDKIPNQRIQAWDLLMYEAY